MGTEWRIGTEGVGSKWRHKYKQGPEPRREAGRRGPMECVEVMAEHTNPAGDMLPPPQENHDAKTKEWDETQKERRWQALGSG